MMKGKDQLMRRKPSIAANIAFNLASEEAEAEAAGSHIELGTEGVHLSPTGASIITVLPVPDEPRGKEPLPIPGATPALGQHDDDGVHSVEAGKSAAMAIWLGLAIDALPESVVIGLLCLSESGVSIAFIAGVFLANLPEALSASVAMRRAGLSQLRIYLMWWSITLETGIGAMLAAAVFPPPPHSESMVYVLHGIEGLAGGAMLTVICETMLPEAFHEGGKVVGMSALSGCPYMVITAL